MRFPRTAIAVLLVFIVVTPLIFLALVVLTSPVASYMSWRDAAEECLRANKPAPPFDWTSSLGPLSLTSLSYMPLFYGMLIPQSAVFGVVPALFAGYRRYLSLGAVVLASCLMMLGHAVIGDGFSILTALSYLAAGLPCLWLLRRLGVPAAPPPTAGPPAPT